MAAKKISRIIGAISLVLFMLALSGCWGGRELDTIFLVTGVAMDKANAPDLIDIALQVAKNDPSGGSSSSSAGSGGSSQGEPFMILKAQKSSLAQGIANIDLKNSHKVFLHHNQVILFGSEFAKEGVGKHIDMLLRDDEARLEVPVIVVDGKASDILTVQTEHEKLSGLFLHHLMGDQVSISVEYSVRLIDFATRLLDKTTAPVMPIVKLIEEDGKKNISLEGMAVFKEDRLVGRLSNDQAQGFVWAMGNVKNSTFTAGSAPDIAVFFATKLDCKNDVKLRKDGGLSVKLSVDATLAVSELIGYDSTPSKDLVHRLEEVSKEEITRRITETFDVARTMGTDIFGISRAVHRKYPKEYKAMEKWWSDYFSDVELDVQVKTHVREMGKSVRTLKMEAENED